MSDHAPVYALPRSRPPADQHPIAERRRSQHRNPGRPGRGHRNETVELGWLDQAACRTKQADLFFPNGTTTRARRQLAKAKAVCHHCPVTAQCLAWAMDTNQREGVWGGLSEHERHALRQGGYRVTARAHLIVISPSRDNTPAGEHP
jgi:WhiB family redox-sensing transcriptional regulator